MPRHRKGNRLPPRQAKRPDVKFIWPVAPSPLTLEDVPLPPSLEEILLRGTAPTMHEQRIKDIRQEQLRDIQGRIMSGQVTPGLASIRQAALWIASDGRHSFTTLDVEWILRAGGVMRVPPARPHPVSPALFRRALRMLAELIQKAEGLGARRAYVSAVARRFESGHISRA